MIATKDGVINIPTRTTEFKLSDPNFNYDLNLGYTSEFKE